MEEEEEGAQIGFRAGKVIYCVSRGAKAGGSFSVCAVLYTHCSAKALQFRM